MRSESFQLSLENRVSVHHHGHEDQIRRAQEHPFRKLTMSQTYSIFNNLGCSLGGRFPSSSIRNHVASPSSKGCLVEKLLPLVKNLSVIWAGKSMS
jgi:hypothetical protein